MGIPAQVILTHRGVCLQNCDVLRGEATFHYAFMRNCWAHFSPQLILMLSLRLQRTRCKRVPADLFWLLLRLVFAEPQLLGFHSHSCEVR